MQTENLLRKLASPALHASGSYARGWARSTHAGPVTLVLVYHRIAANTPAATDRFDIEEGIPARVFERQIRFMLKRFKPVACSQVLDPGRAPLSFAVSFDDGYRDNCQIAAPILRRLGVPATFFVVSDFVGSDCLFWWEQVAAMIRATTMSSLVPAALSPRLGAHDTRLSLRTAARRRSAYEALCKALRSGPGSEIPGVIDRLREHLRVPLREAGRDDALMDWDDLRSLSRDGFEIGGHTASHCNVPACDTQTLRREIVESAARIENELQEPVLTFAYPYGFSDPVQSDAARMLEAAHCRVAFTGAKGVVTGKSPRFALPRVHLNRRFSFVWAYNVQDALNATLAGPPGR